MKKFPILFTLLLLVNFAFGQLATATFDAALDGLVPGVNVATADLNTPGAFTSTGCVGGSRVLDVTTTANINLGILPNAGFDLIMTDLVVILQKDKNSTCDVSILVNGVPFSTTQSFTNNTCNTLTFIGTPVTAPTITVDINITFSNSSGKVLTFDGIVVGGTFTGSVLPVELSKFNVKKAEQSIMLSWATASEKNNKHFEIQKSTNGTQFQTIGQVKGSGTNLSGASYNFEDKNPSVGITYYRLKQVDDDGKYAYTAVRSILFGKSKIVVFSTIAKDRISLTVSDDQIVPFDIINLNGQKVLAGKAIGQHTIDISGLHSGMYFIRTEGGEVTRFVKD